MKPLFEYKDYKTYLADVLKQRGTGERSRMAAAIRCHSGYVSQVLNGKAHFSLEQGEEIARFLGLNKDQTQFLFLLIQAERAGTASLRSHFQEQMKALAEKQFVLKDRLQYERTLSREDQSTFYSSWIYGAVHVLVSVPGCETPQGLSRYLGVPVEKVHEVVEFLVSVGLLARSKNDHLSIGTSHIHLEGDSPLISKHHTNWRLRAMQSLDLVETQDLHYSSVITASEEDSVRIREILVRAIEEVRKVVKPSRDEGAYAYSLDFFGLKKR